MKRVRARGMKGTREMEVPVRKLKRRTGSENNKVNNIERLFIINI